MLTSLNKKECIPTLMNAITDLRKEEGTILLQYAYAKQAYLINPDAPAALEKFANILFELKDYNSALKCADKWFADNKDSSSSSNTRANMFYIRGISSFYLKKYDNVVNNLQKAINGLMHSRENAKEAEAKRILEEELPKAKESPNTKPASVRREECVTVKKYLELNEIPDVPGKLAYILPNDWLDKWKEFNNYYEFVGDEHEKKNFMEEEREKVEWLGPIDPTNLLVPEPNLVDSDPSEWYANFQIKQGLEENKDFFIISEEFWKYLSDIYGGIPLQRPTYRKSENNMTVSVEVWLQKVNVIMLPIPRKEQPQKLDQVDPVFISKRKTVKELKEKLSRAYTTIFPNYHDFETVKSRVWKVDPRFELEYAWKKWNGDNQFEIQGNILDDETSIEDAEISDDDTIIFEIHYLPREWFLSDDALGIKNKNKGGKEGSMVLSLNGAKDFPPGAKKGLTGLQNLGNTCFMNSAIQCLSNTFDATTFFLTDEYKKDINKLNPLGSGGKLAYYYSELMKEVWLGSSSYVSPWELKKTIGRLASQFVGYGQQDSQELLSYLLDGLHEDLNRVIEKPFIEIKEDDTRPDEVVAEESWNNHLRRNKSRIQELMHGQFKSRLDCPDCKKISITFDPYMMISLPIPTVEYTKFFMYFVFNSHERTPIKITFNLPANSSYSEILGKLQDLIKVSKKNIVMGLLKEHKLIEYVDTKVDALYLKEHAGILFAYEIAPAPFDANYGKKNEDSSENNEEKTTMETENDEDPTELINNLLRVYIQSDPKAFYESEKTISYTRLIKFEPSDTYKDIHLKVYERMRHHIAKYLEKEKSIKNAIKLEDRSRATIEKEYLALFPEDNESAWIYKLHLVNSSKEDPRTGKKTPCEICQKAKCAKCLFPYEDVKFEHYLDKMKLAVKDILFELKLASKSVKIESLALNQCTEFKGGENDETNPNRNYNIYDCLNLFTRKEKLEKDNAWYCSKCKGHKEALKKMEIYKVPPVLIIHLKRFKTSKTSSIGPFYWSQGKKINAVIDFPIQGLDLSNYVLGKDKNAIYDLYAVSNHYGGLSGGHYTAYAKNPINNHWYDFNDSRVSPVNEKEIVGVAAYVLFYRRRDATSEK